MLVIADEANASPRSLGGSWPTRGPGPSTGFGGLRDSDGRVQLQPRLPAAWDRLRFRIQVRGQLIEVDMTAAETTYRLLDGSGILIEHRGEALRLLRGRPVSRPAEDGPAETGLPLAA